MQVLIRKYLRTSHFQLKCIKHNLYSQTILLEDSLTQWGCFAKGLHGLIRRTEKYRTPIGSCSRRSKQTAHDATRRSVWRLWHCTLGRLALLFRLLSLPQPFRSTLFSSRHKQWDNNVRIIHTKHRGTLIFVKKKLKITWKVFFTFYFTFCIWHSYKRILQNPEMPNGTAWKKKVRVF